MGGVTLIGGLGMGASEEGFCGNPVPVVADTLGAEERGRPVPTAGFCLLACIVACLNICAATAAAPP